MKLVLTRAVQRRLGQMNPKMRAALFERLEAIAEQPFATHRNVERLKGDWRALYRIDRQAGEMRVLVVEPRGSVYR